MGVIPKRAVTQFLKRPRDDFRHYKRLTYKQLSSMKRRLEAKPPIWKKLWKHQRACFLLGVKCKKFFYCLDTGCGKTLLSLSLIRYFRKVDKTTRFLIVVPNRINVYEWEAEIQIHCPKTKYLLLDQATPKNWENLMESDATINVITFGGLRYMVCGLRKKKKGSSNEMFISDKHVGWMSKCLNGVIVDESTFVGNHDSLDTRIISRLMRKAKYGALLSGTPFGKDPKMLWSQMKLVDGGHSLGETLGLFRAAFYREVENHFSSFPDFEFIHSKKQQLHDFIAHRSIRFKASGLPPCVPITKTVPLSTEAYPFFDAAQAAFDEAVRGYGSGNLQQIQSSFVLLRQISSGYVGYKDVVDGSKIQFEFKEKPKLEMLLSLLQEVAPNHKSIIFFDYVPTGRIIARELRALKIGCHLIQGGVKDQKGKLHEFKHDDRIRALVLNNSCGGYGLNLQVARYGFYYESPLSPIMRTQTRRRFERQGSKHDSVFLYDLITKGTKDQAILDAIAEGRNLFDAVIEGKGGLI